jgi:hypothetical protein
MMKLESALDKLADSILGLDEASLTALLPTYRQRMEHFEPTRDWEKAVISFFIINAVRAKNHIFNEQIMQRGKSTPEKKSPGKPTLHRVK